ncbi:MAG: carboxylating nicotinate-nucleotide diphosphorylase, partial [Candidatus Cloacimonetes bacterium]|nr:carboxylating nicotinate-nucleotide diphosphorylase [Candidatus Cloacimonadota bacterium]
MLIDEIIRKSLEEDLGSGDITTRYLDLDPAICSAYMIAKADGILAGTDIAKEVFKAVDPELKITLYRKDGDMVHPKDEIMRVEGKPSSILQAERTALNFLQRLSGIASQTRRMVDAIAGTNTKLLDTRKTTPLLRSLEKYAVRVGGGLNHRHGLYDMIMLKENHIRAAGGISKAIQKIQTQNASYKLEVEVTNLQELEEAVAATADSVMQDNMCI